MRPSGRSGRRTVGGPGGTRGIAHVDLDVFPPNPIDRGNRGSRRANESGRIFGGQQEGKGHLAFFSDAQIPNHPGGQKIVFQTRILDRRERSGYASFEGFQDLDRLDVLHFGYHLAEPALDTLLERNG